MSAAGRRDRGLSVILGSKIDVHVNAIGRSCEVHVKVVKEAFTVGEVGQNRSRNG